MPAERGQPLTDRELSVARLVAQDWTDMRICRHLFLSPSVVSVCIRDVKVKTGAKDRIQVARWAMGLEIDPENAATAAGAGGHGA